jgi:hypothetical protein
MAANVALFVDDAKSQPRISAVEIGEDASEGAALSDDNGGIRGIAAQRAWNQDAYGVVGHAASIE